MRTSGTLLVVLASLLMSSVFAASPERLSNIITEQKAIAARLDAGDTQSMKGKQVRTVRRNQKIVFDLAADKQSLDQFSPKDRVRLKNALDAISAALVGNQKAEDDQDYCWQDRSIGSRVSKHRCGTALEREQAREDANAYLTSGKDCADTNCAQQANRPR